MSQAIVLHQKADLIPCTKSLILVEPLDKLTNYALAEKATVIIDTISNTRCKTTLVRNNTYQKLKEEKKQPNIGKINELITYSDTMKIAKKYFNIWKTRVKQKGNDDFKKEKIDNFLKQLKKSVHTIDNKSSDNFSESDKNQSKYCAKYRGATYKNVSEMYVNRYKAQQNLIKSQKVKLQEQEKLIEKLKLGIIIEETEKSLENSKYEIREIFKRCSEKVRCKITPPDAVDKDINLIELKSSKAPKIILQMEKRAAERAIRRSIILEKKKLMEKEKHEELEKAIERKKAVDEEQRQKNLGAIRERKRLEAELRKRRQENKQKFLECINKANKFYKKKMKYKIFNGFKRLLEIKCENELKSGLFYKNLLMKGTLNEWKLFIKQKLEKENLEANYLYSYKLLKKVFKSWQMILTLQRQSMQVAEDLYDMKLQSRIFLFWHRHICHEQMIEYNNLQKASKHYNSRILLQYFYQWKSLPAVLQLEKAKEEKKRKWREKVWEIIPDYQPYMEVI